MGISEPHLTRGKIRGYGSEKGGCGSSVVEHTLGKGEVESSILSHSTINLFKNKRLEAAGDGSPCYPALPQSFVRPHFREAPATFCCAITGVWPIHSSQLSLTRFGRECRRDTGCGIARTTAPADATAHPLRGGLGLCDRLWWRPSRLQQLGRSRWRPVQVSYLPRQGIQRER